MAKSETPASDALLVKYLNEAYGKERQLTATLQTQIGLARRPQLKKGLQDHLKVTRDQAKAIERRIKELGGKAEKGGSSLPGPEVATGAVTAVANQALALAKGPVQALRGTSEADNELRNVRDCYWNEAEEIAHYIVIENLANELGDRETAKLARDFRKQEERMQALLERQVPQLLKAIVKEEIPSSERNASGRFTRSSSRSSSSRSTSKSSSTNGSSSKGSSTKSSSSKSSSSRSTSRATSRSSSSRSTSKGSGTKKISSSSKKTASKS